MDAQEPSEKLAAINQDGGLWQWLRNLLARLCGASPTSASPAGDAAIDTAAADQTGQTTSSTETYVVAPCGYRIRVPQPDDMSHCVGELIPGVRQAMAAVPPLPHVAIELIKEVQNPSSTAASVAKIAANDPALTASLLQTVNSAAVGGLDRRITAVSDAIAYLGFTTVRSMVLKLQLDRVLPRNHPEKAAAAQQLWTHSLAVSYVADVLAQRVANVDRGMVSTLGLLHDIGKLAMVTQLNKEGTAEDLGDESAAAHEARIYGADHAGLGAALAHRWGLPADLVLAIRWHHHPEKAFESTDPPALRRAVYLVQIANELAKYCYPYSQQMELDPAPGAAGGACEVLSLGKSLAQLLDAKVRDAVTRAMFYAVENADSALPTPQAFLHLRRGEAAAQLAAVASAGRVHVDDDKVNAALGAAAGTETAPSWKSFDLNAAGAGVPSEKILRAAPSAHFVAASTKPGLQRLAAAAVAHQNTLDLTPRQRGAAAFTLRALLANLVEADSPNNPVEVGQSFAGGRFSLAVKSTSLEFARRLDAAHVSAGPQLVEAELAGLLNLEWFESVSVSADGSAWLFA